MSAVQKTRINERIQAPKVRVINEQGEMLGIMPTPEALAFAKSQGLDLIEVSPKSDPPVVKVLSYDKYRYHLEKSFQQLRKNRKKIEIKGIRISVRIGEHDLEFKAQQADKFLQKGSKVKIEMFLRGRERANVDFAFQVLKKFLERVSLPHHIEQEPKKLGGMITMVIAPQT